MINMNLMNKVFDVTIPLKTVSELNDQSHWRIKHKRHQKQKKWVAWELCASKPLITTPVKIVLTRIAPRTFDYVNLVSSFKWIEDSVCEYIYPGLAPGRADGMPGITTFFSQEKGLPKEYAFKIEIYCD